MGETDELGEVTAGSEAGLERPERTATRRPQPRRRRSKSGKRWAAVAVVVLVLAASGWAMYSALGKNTPTAQYVTQRVTSGTLTVTVDGNGTVVSNSSTAVDPGVSGTVKDLDVRPGSQVKEGQLLFVIENPDLDASVQQAKSQYFQSQASVTKAKQSLDQAKTSLTTGPQQAKSQYLQAQSSTSKALQQMTQARAELDALIAKDEADPASVTDAQLTAARENYSAAHASYDAAVTSEKTAYTNYKQSKTTAQQNYSAAQQSYNAAVASEKTAYMNYQQALEDADKRDVKAPIDGYVTALNVRNGDQVGAGSTGSSGQSQAGGTSTTSSSSSSAPIVITDMSDLVAEVDISEADRPKVKTGQKVECTFDALEDVTITGEVSEIDAVGTNTSGVVTYGVTVTFDVQDPRLKPSMTAAASIITAVYPDVVLAPNAAIKTDSSGNKYVQVLSDPNGTPQNVTVTVAAAGASQTVITSGLKGGESVVTSTATSGSSSTSSSGSSNRGGGFILGGEGGPPSR